MAKTVKDEGLTSWELQISWEYHGSFEEFQVARQELDQELFDYLVII